MIIITDETKRQIKEILEQNPGKYLHVEVEGDGCAGPYLRVFLDEAQANEVITSINGVDILISDQVKRYSLK